MSEYKLNDVLDYISKPIQQYHTQKNDFSSDPSANNLTLENNDLGFISSLIFSLISSSNNKKNTNNLFINTDDLLQNLKNEHDENTPKNIAKINQIYKTLETQLIHNLINFLNDLDDIQVNVIYVNNLYTPKDESFLKNIASIQQFHNTSNKTQTLKHQICLFIPKFEDDLITGTEIQKRCSMKIDHYFNRIQQFNSDSQVNNLKLQSIGIVISNIELLNKNMFLKKKFWLSCSGGATIEFLNKFHDLNIVENKAKKLFNFFLVYMTTCWQPFKSPISKTFNNKLKQYILDIVVHLRLQRFSQQGRGGGISSMSLNDMIQVSISLSILDNFYDGLMDFIDINGDNVDEYLKEKDEIKFNDEMTCKENVIVTPDIVKIAARVYFPFKLQLTINSSNKRQRKDYSIAYGSDKEVVDELIDNLKDLEILNKNEDLKGQYTMERLVVEDVLRHISTSF